MAEPFVFNFKPGEHGEPLQMYIADVRGECELCGAGQLQRFYHAASFHRLSIDLLESLALTACAKLGIECKNCGEFVGPDGATEATFIWGFADDAGVMTAWVDRESITGWRFEENRRLDPQALPGFDLPEDLETLSEEAIEKKFGRVLNPKKLWLELFDEVEADPGVAYELAAPDHLFAVGTEAVDDLFDDDAVVVDLSCDSDLDLPLNVSRESLFAAPIGWLSSQRIEDLESGQVFAKASVPIEPIRYAIERAFEVGNLTFRFDEKTQCYTEITTPTETTFERPVGVVSVAKRAVYTGITPGEAARLTAEEVVGTLLRVWS